MKVFLVALFATGCSAFHNPGLLLPNVRRSKILQMSTVNADNNNMQERSAQLTARNTAVESVVPPERREEYAQQMQQQQGRQSHQQQPVSNAGMSEGAFNVVKTGLFGLTVIGLAGVSALKAKTAFAGRQELNADEFAVSVMYDYGDAVKIEETVREYTGQKLGAGKDALFAKFAALLADSRPASVEAIACLKTVIKAMDLSDAKAGELLEKAVETCSASTQGKLLFAAERVLKSPAATAGLRKRMPYDDVVITGMQTVMLEQVYRGMIDALGDAPTGPPAGAAELGMSDEKAQSIFDAVMAERKAEAEKEPELSPEAMLMKSVAEDAGKSVKDLEVELRREAAEADAPKDSGDSSGPPVNLLGDDDDDVPTAGGGGGIHEYECTQCGFTLFPAAGREFKFYGDDFKCPGCGAGKDKFVDNGPAGLDDGPGGGDDGPGLAQA